MHSDLVHTLYGQIDLAPTRDAFENSDPTKTHGAGRNRGFVAGQRELIWW